MSLRIGVAGQHAQPLRLALDETLKPAFLAPRDPGPPKFLKFRIILHYPVILSGTKSNLAL
jgi:hypothetical protein